MHRSTIVLTGIAATAVVCLVLLWVAGRHDGDSVANPAAQLTQGMPGTDVGLGPSPSVPATRASMHLARLEVTVVDRLFGAPVTGARAMSVVGRGADTPAIQGRQLGTGRFVFESLPRGTDIEVVIDAEGYESERTKHHLTAANEELLVRLSGMLVLHGRARSARTKAPVPDVDVMVECLLGDAVIRTDQAGEFRFAAIPPGSLEILARKQGYSDAVAVLDLHESQSLEIELHPRGMVDLTIQTNATTGYGANLLYVVASADGAVLWEGFVPFQDGVARVRIPAEDSVDSMGVTVHLPSGQNTTVPAAITEFRGMRLARAELRSPWLLFRLRSPNGPLCNTTVQFRAGAESHSLTTSDSGLAQLPSTALANRTIVFWTQKLLSDVVPIAAGTDDIAVCLKPRDKGILVVGAEKIGFSPADIGIHSSAGARGFPRIESGSQVRFAVPPGHYLVTVRGAVAHTLPLERAEEDVTVDLEKSQHGRVVGRGFHPGPLRFWKKERTGWIPIFDPVAADDGTFELPTVFAGEYLLGNAPGKTLRRLLVGDGQTVELDGSQLGFHKRRIQVLNAWHLPVVDQDVVVPSEVGLPPLRHKTDLSGEIEISLRADRQALRILVAGETIVVDLRPDAPRPVPIVLSPADGESCSLARDIGPVRRILLLREQAHGYSMATAARRGKAFRIPAGCLLVLAQTLAGYQPLEIDRRMRQLQLPDPTAVPSPTVASAYLTAVSGRDVAAEGWKIPAIWQRGELMVRLPRGATVLLQSEGKKWTTDIK